MKDEISRKIIPNYDEDRDFYRRNPEIEAGWFLAAIFGGCVILAIGLAVYMVLANIFGWPL